MNIEENKTPPSRIQWLSDLIRLEIVLWDRIDARLRSQHNMPLAYFEPLYSIAQTPEGSLRVGDLAQVLRVTVGGMSKIIDRIERAGLIRREADPTDRRASRVALTSAGSCAVAAARETYEAEMTTVLNAVLSMDEQQQMHGLVTRLLAATTNHESETSTSADIQKQEQHP